MRDCEICGGAQVIRLPVRRRVAMTYSSEVPIPAPIDDSFRTYGCPECGPKADDNRVVLVGAAQVATTLYEGEPGYEEHIRRDVARQLADEIVRGGFVEFTKGELNNLNMSREHQAMVGVVSRKQAQTIDQRIKERQDEVARRVVDLACSDIDVWGRDYGHTNLSKGQAKDSVRRALNQILETA